MNLRGVCSAEWLGRKPPTKLIDLVRGKKEVGMSANKKEIKDFPKLPFTTSFIRKLLSAIQLGS
jgi:hypothetical protein